MKLTQSKIDGIKYSEKRQSVTDDDMPGLTLIVGAKSKVWYYVFRDADGKKGRRKLGSADVLTVAQARDEAKKLGGKVVQGENIRKEKPAEKLTLGAFLENTYFPHLRLDHKTADEISRALTVNFKPLFKLPIEQINPGHIEQWRTQRRAAGLRFASINRTVTYLKASLNWAFKSGIIDKNPLARVSPLKERDSKLVIRYLTPEERDRLEAALIDRETRIRANREHANALRGEGKALPLFKDEFVDYLRPAVTLSLLTGIRRGALFALAWGDVDFTLRTVTLRGDDAKDGKTHVLPLCDDAVDILSSWRKQSENMADGDLIFPSPKKKGQQISEIKTAWGALLKIANIKDFRWHDLRHSFASSLVQAGVDLNTVRELLTHSDIKMTMRYAHLAPENKLHAVQVLNHSKGKIIGRIRKASA